MKHCDIKYTQAKLIILKIKGKQGHSRARNLTKIFRNIVHWL